LHVYFLRIINYTIYLAGTTPASFNRYNSGTPFQGVNSYVISADDEDRLYLIIGRCPIDA
jgi:hypothetical protein